MMQKYHTKLHTKCSKNMQAKYQFKPLKAIWILTIKIN